jgi:hypothetical protein
MGHGGFKVLMGRIDRQAILESMNPGGLEWYLTKSRASL